MPDSQGLVKVRSSKFDDVFVRPGANFRGYTRIMIDPAQAALAENWLRNMNTPPLAILRRTTAQDAAQIVDQARNMRKTHGAQACDGMLEKVEHVLANGLRPAERMGRWGDDEYLILSHERTPEMLASHAQVLAGLARTADFRWWGDRVSLTVSVGAAQAERDGSLIDLLERAKAAMFSSIHAGGNHITSAPGRKACSPS